MNTKIQLDEMLDPERAAQWLGISHRELAEKRRTGKIPAIVLGERTVRFHPRTVITKLALDSGVSPKVIATMFNALPVS